MPIQFKCPKCSKAFKVKDELAGKVAGCPCGAKFRVPAPKGAAPAAKKPAPKPKAEAPAPPPPPKEEPPAPPEPEESEEETPPPPAPEPPEEPEDDAFDMEGPEEDEETEDQDFDSGLDDEDDDLGGSGDEDDEEEEESASAAEDDEEEGDDESEEDDEESDDEEDDDEEEGDGEPATSLPGRILVIVGAALIVAGFFLPWMELDSSKISALIREASRYAWAAPADGRGQILAMTAEEARAMTPAPAHEANTRAAVRPIAADGFDEWQVPAAGGAADGAETEAAEGGDDTAEDGAATDDATPPPAPGEGDGAGWTPPGGGDETTETPKKIASDGAKTALTGMSAPGQLGGMAFAAYGMVGAAALLLILALIPGKILSGGAQMILGLLLTIAVPACGALTLLAASGPAGGFGAVFAAAGLGLYLTLAGMVLCLVGGLLCSFGVFRNAAAPAKAKPARGGRAARSARGGRASRRRGGDDDDGDEEDDEAGDDDADEDDDAPAAEEKKRPARASARPGGAKPKMPIKRPSVKKTGKKSSVRKAVLRPKGAGGSARMPGRKKK